MKKNLSIFCSLLVLLICFEGLKAQTPSFSFENYSIKQGLPSSTVYNILKDKFGFIWLATEDGVARFDGSNFEVYRHNPTISTSLHVNHITALHESRDGGIWIGTNGGGLGYYDREKDSVTSINMPISPAITSLGGDAAGNVWVTVYGGISIIDYKTKKLITPGEYAPLIRLLEGKVCESFLQDNQKRIWIGTQSGLYLYQPDTKTTTVYRHQDTNANSLPDDAVQKLAQDGKGNIWIGTANGLAVLQPGKTDFITYRHTATAPSISSNAIYALATDSHNRLWIGTDEGLDVMDIGTTNITSILPDIRASRSISSRSIRSILIDNQHIYWVGTFRGGLNKYDENINYFNLKEFSAFDPYGLQSPVITSFAGYGPDVYVGTDGGGLQLFHRSSGLFSRISLPVSSANNQKYLTILALEMARNNRLWVGSFHDGLYSLSPATGAVQHYLKGSSIQDLNNNDIFCLKEDSKGNMWVGTNGGGVNVILADGSGIDKYYYNPADPARKNWLGNNFIRVINEDKSGNIWIGTFGGGLFVFNPATKAFTAYNYYNSNLPSDYVISISIDRVGNIWVGTNGNGLGLLKYGSKHFEQINQTSGLKNGVINAIQEDDAGTIWMSTNDGLTSLEPTSRKIKNYTTHNGLQSGSFMPRASLKLDDNELFFGGENGFNHFYPAHLKINRNVPPVVFTSLKVDNKPVSPGPDAPISNAMLLADEIRLHYKQSFSIVFEALNFTAPEANQYEYQLLGIDKNWLQAGKDHSAYYANIPPGEYTFKVRASNNDGIWNEQGRSIKVVIVPPFWRTTWAYLAYLLLFATGLLYIRYRGIKRLKAQFELQQERQKVALLLEQERKEAETIHNLDQQKIKFLTNLSHEFRTPISLIAGPADTLLANGSNERQNSQLQLIKRNSRRLLNLVNQLLDFRKMEENELSLQLSDGEFVSFIKDVTDSFKDLSEKKEIEFIFNSSFPELYTRFDQDKTERIIFNLLSNAFKFTLQGGKVSLLLHRKDTGDNPDSTTVVMQITDTGVGMPADQQAKIFERFYQHTTAGKVLNQGTGIGLSITKEFVEMQGGSITVSSELDKGTTFTILLPLVVLAAPNAIPVPNNLLPETEIADLEEETTEIAEEKQTATAVANTTQGFTVLLVEDNEDLRFYLKDNLQQQYKVYEAANGKEGWQKALAQHPHIIVSDVSMPVMDGVELCKKLKSDKRTSHIPVILLTALSAEQDLLRGLETGANDYITKPFNIEVLNAKIKNLLILNDTLKTTYTKQIKVLAPEVKIESENEKLIERVMLYLEENLINSELSVEDLSRHVGMSRTSLYSKLLEITGQTPVEFIRTVKLEKAAVLLQRSDMTIAQIAYSVGFSTPNYFAKSFKSKFNMSPSEYVQKQKNDGKEKNSDETNDSP